MGVSFHKPVLVGRERERQALRALLGRASEGSGTLVLLSGEAGIGKTTLVDDLVRNAAASGFFVLSGGCYDLTTTPPYGPWTEAIRSYRPGAGQPAIPNWFGNFDEIEKLGSQTAIFEGARDFFAGIAEHQPLLIVLEDLHWADPASVDALRYLARNLRDVPVLILATYRDDEPASDHPFFEAIPALVRESQAERIAVQRWSEPNTRDLIASRYRLRLEDEERLAGHTHRLAEGNPFYTIELLHELESDATLLPQAGGWALGELIDTQIPPLVRQVIEQRLKRLSDEPRCLLEIGSVIGHEVPFDLWQRVSETTESELSGAIEEALNAQLADELSDGSGIAFRHALIRETLYEGIVSLRRRSIHRKIGEALASRDSSDSDTVAEHFLRAHDARAVEWLIRSAERAESVFALMMAADRLIQVQEMLGDDPEHLRDRGWLVYRIGRLTRQSDTPLALKYFATSEDLAAQANDEYLCAACRYQRGFMLCWLKNYRDGIALMLEAVPILNRLRPAVDIPALGRGPYTMGDGGVDSGYIVQIMGVGRFEQGVPILEAHIANRGKHGQLDLMMGWYHALTGRPSKARSAIARAITWHDTHAHYHMAALDRGVLIHQFYLTYEADRIAELRACYEEIGDVWQKAADGGWSGYRPPRNLWYVDFIWGDWDRAECQARIAVEDTQYMIHSEEAASCLAAIVLERGDVEEAGKLVYSVLSDGAASMPGDYRIWTALELLRVAAAARLNADDPIAALEWLEAHDRWLEWCGAVLGQAEGHLLWARYYLADGGCEQARERAEKALTCAGDPRQPLALIATHRFLGELDTRERDYDGAREHLTASTALAERCESPFEIALTQLAQAELALATRDVPRATYLIDQAKETFERLGAKPALERAGRVATQLAMEAHAYPAGLTPREVEVLCLVAEGLSNREIAERLYLSVRTVERHISNIYIKIGSANRIDAATFAHRHQLTDILDT